MRIAWVQAVCCTLASRGEDFLNGGSVVITYSVLGVLLAVAVMTIYIWSIKRPREGNNDKHHAKHHQK
jgi:flagellar basal body-associated protein FliL